MSGSDVVSRLKGVGLGIDGIVEVKGLIAASFCCRSEISGGFSSKVGKSFALLSWAFGSVPADPNNGEVPNEKTGGANEAAGWSDTISDLGGAAAPVEFGNISATAFVGSRVVVAEIVVEGWPKVGFFSMDEANGESTEPLLSPSDLGADCEGKKLNLGCSLMSETLGLPLESSALVVFAGELKLNFGGFLLSRGL